MPEELVVGRFGIATALVIDIAIIGEVGNHGSTVEVGCEGKIMLAHPPHDGEALRFKPPLRQLEGSVAIAHRRQGD